MNGVATTDICRSCGAVLSRYREPGEELCAPCRRTTVENEIPPRTLDAEQFVDAVAAVLLLGRVLAAGRRVHVRELLADLGVEADHVDVFRAVQKLRRRYQMQIDADERQSGYKLELWPYRFTRRRLRRGQQIPLFSQEDTSVSRPDCALEKRQYYLTRGQP